jgi:hypothetical protein
MDLEDPDLALRLAVVLLHSKAVPGVSKSAAAALQSAVAAESSTALGLFRATAERWRHHAVPFETAHALVGQASCLLELERVSDAGAALDAAIEIFERLGARPDLNAAQSLRQRAM